MLHAVVMAGGSGTRFWPESRDLRPKQLLTMSGRRSMLQATVDRLAGLVPPERILVVTGRRLADAVAAQLPELPPQAVVGEPCRRDTAPCIGLAASLVSRADPDATLLVVPSDHVIETAEAFRGGVELAVSLIDERPGRIVTFGIRPTYPAESFGYIERGERLPARRASSAGGAIGSGASAGAAFQAPAYEVVRFREKPRADVARQYLEAGTFYWNSGIFVWRAATILAALAEHQPDLHARVGTIAAHYGRPDYEAVLEREFTAIQGISVDFAVMEHAREVVVIEAPFTWDDLGSWQALARLHGTDEQGNTVIGRHVGLNTTGTIVRGSDDHLVVTLGLRDCLVVHTPDATLVANKHDEEAIRQVVARLRELGWNEYL